MKAIQVVQRMGSTIGNVSDATIITLAATKVGSNLAYTIAYRVPLCSIVNYAPQIGLGAAGLGVKSDVTLLLTGKQTWAVTLQ
jgi:hypothetical protein